MRLIDIDAFLESIDNPVQYRTLKRLMDEAETVQVKGDLISKKSLRDALRKHFVPDPNKAPDYLVDFLMEVNGVLENLPIEKSEIVLCKDCARYQTERCFMHIERLWELTPKDYCSQAERKDGDGNG